MEKTIKAVIFEVMATLSSSGESVVIFFIIAQTAMLAMFGCVAYFFKAKFKGGVK